MIKIYTLLQVRGYPVSFGHRPPIITGFRCSASTAMV